MDLHNKFPTVNLILWTTFSRKVFSPASFVYKDVKNLCECGEINIFLCYILLFFLNRPLKWFLTYLFCHQGILELHHLSEFKVRRGEKPSLVPTT